MENQEVVITPLTLEELKEKILSKNVVLTSLMRGTIEAAWEIGGYLIMAKAQIPHGKFQPWVKKNLPIKNGQAGKYMRLRQRHINLESALVFTTIDDAAVGYDKKANEKVIHEVVPRHTKEDLNLGEQTQQDAMKQLGLMPLTERTLGAIKDCLLEEYGEEALDSIVKLEGVV